ncbi:chromosome partition protein Smc-like [Littorina saxatilis]|uniref:Death domain-containing protein n=1 Tax=Littorina saxatilis TaxID=31220 RepID=A0AAN9AIC7_9CAEN
MKKSFQQEPALPEKILPPPISLEAERRKAMMLIHSVEKEIVSYREKYFRRPRNHFSIDSVDLIHFVLEKAETRKLPKTHEDFRPHYEKAREAAVILYARDVPHMDAALERAVHFEELVANASQKLREALEDHIGRYCHSFSAEAGTNEIRCVQEYENNITRWRGVIKDSFALLDDVLKSIKDAGPTFENYVLNYDKVLHYMHLALEVFPRIYNPLKDWVTADEAYARKLQDEANDILRRKVQVTEDTRRSLMRSDDMKGKVNRTHHQTTKLREKLVRSMEQRRFCRRQEMVLVDSGTKLESEIETKKRELDACLQEYYTRQYNSENLYKRIMAKATGQQAELGKLEKRLDAVRLNMDKVRKERYSVQKEVHKFQALFDRSNRAGGLAYVDAEGKSRELRDLQDENKTMAEKLAALRTIRAIKINPGTVKKIHAEGFSPGRKLSVFDPFEEAFRVTAADIGQDWAFLYNKLPFTPERDMNTRSHDIQVIDLGSQKQDIGLRGAAVRSLEKWKRLSQNASINALVRTLKSIKKQAVANKIEEKINVVR